MKILFCLVALFSFFLLAFPKPWKANSLDEMEDDMDFRAIEHLSAKQSRESIYHPPSFLEVKFSSRFVFSPNFAHFQRMIWKLVK